MNKQQQLVRYAEAMGWESEGTARYGVWVGGEFGVVDGSFCVKRADESYPETWNPLTDANDALELAEKMNIAFERFFNGPYWALAPGTAAKKPLRTTLPSAICAAVDAALAKKSREKP